MNLNQGFDTWNKKSWNTGQIASRDSSFRDAGQIPPNTGRPLKYGTPGKPTTVADYVLLLFIFIFFYFLFLFFFIHRSFSETTRPILTKFSGIVYSGVVWIIQYLWNSSDAISRRKTPKTAKIWSKFHGLTQIFDNNFKTVEDNSNLKQTWTREIVSIHFWQISLWMVWGQLRSICPMGWQICIFVRLLHYLC